YEEAHGRFPPAAIRSKDGQPLLSWRVLILPYMEQDHIYRSFKLDEPWDSPHNSQLLRHMPPWYRLEGPEPAPLTRYQALVGPGAAFDAGGPKGPALADFTDGPAKTILIGTAAVAVPWTKPDELEYSPAGPLPRFSRHFDRGFH